MLGGLNNLYRMSLLLTADVRGFTSGLTRAETRLSKFAARATSFGRSTARGLGLAFAYIGSQAVKAAADFDRASFLLEKIVGGQGIDRLTEQAKQLGRESVFMATDIAKAQLEIAKLGLRGDALSNVLVKAKDIATVFGTDIESTGKSLLSVLRQFGLSTEDTEEGAENIAFAADVMARAFQTSALDLSSFTEAMKNVGPTARATGLDMVEATALLAVLANNAVKGSLGGTKLRSTLSDLAAQFPDVADALERLENGTLSYAELVELLNKRAALVGAIFQDQGDEIRDFERILRGASGALDTLSSDIEGQLFFQVDRLKNGFQSLGRTLGEGLSPIVFEFADAVSEMAEAFDKTDREDIERVARAVLFFIEAAAGAFVLGKAVAGIVGLRNAINGLDKLISVGGGNMVNFGRAIKAVGGPLLAITGLIYGVQKAVEYAFSEERILRQNRFLREQKAEYDRLYEAVERLRRAEQQRNQQEKDTPAQTIKDLEDFLKLKGIEAAFEDVGFFQQLQTDVLNELARLDPIVKEIKRQRVAGTEDPLAVESNNETIKKFEDNNTYLKDVLEVRLDALARYIDLLSNLPEPKDPIKVGDGLVAGRRFEVPLRFGEEDVIKGTIDDLDDLLKVQQGIQNLPKAGTGGIFIFDEDRTEAQAISAQRAAAAINDLSQANIDAAIASRGLVITQDKVVDLSSSVTDLLRNLEDFQFVGSEVADAVADAVEQSRVDEVLAASQQVSNFLQSQLDFIGQAFLQASQSGDDFFETLKKTFLDTYRAIVAKLITLIALYAALAVLTTGTGPLAQVASAAMGENFAAFLGNGFGLPTGLSSRSASIDNGGSTPVVRVEGLLTGNDIVLANQRGPRALDRTFG